MSRTGTQGERGESMLELMLWVGATIGVLAVVGYVVFLKPWQEKPIHLTPEQEVYVQSVATQQADAYLRAVATQEAERAVVAPAPQSVPPQSSNYQSPAQPYQPPAQPSAPTVTPIPVAPSQPPPPPPPVSTATAVPPPPPPPPATAAPPPPPPSGSAATTPMGRCVGYMSGLSSGGYDDCVAFVTGSNYKYSHCIGHIIGSPGITDGPSSCVQIAISEVQLGDCLMGLTGQSHYGGTSCRLYYESH